MMHVLGASFFGYSHISIVMQVFSFFMPLWYKSLKGRFLRKVTLFVQCIAKMAITKISSTQQISYPKKKLHIQQIKGPFAMGTHKRVNNKMDIFLLRTNFCRKKGILKCILTVP